MIDIGISDDTIQKKLDANGFKPARKCGKAGEVLDGPTALYRHFDANGILLYVGISLSVIERLRTHSAYSHWYRKIAVITVTYYQTRHNASIAEDLAIDLEKPLYNLNRPEVWDHNVFDPEEAKIKKDQMLYRVVRNFADATLERKEFLREERVLLAKRRERLTRVMDAKTKPSREAKEAKRAARKAALSRARGESQKP